MDNGAFDSGYILRLVGFFGIAIGAAWAIQTLGFGHESLAAKVTWVIAAASMSGAGAGLIVASSAIVENRSMTPARV